MTHRTRLVRGGLPAVLTAGLLTGVLTGLLPLPLLSVSRPAAAQSAPPPADAAPPDTTAATPTARGSTTPPLSAPDATAPGAAAFDATAPNAAAAASSPTATAPNGAAPSSATTAAPPAAAEDIRDIRGPKYGVPLWLIAAAIAGAALLALAAYGIWRWRRARRRPRVLLPFESALQQLDGIRPLMQPASAREFSIAVSDTVRTYIEQRFDVVATHRTTEEFLHDLLETRKPTLARHRGLLAEFLQQCDLVKFGGMSLSMDSIEALFDSARGFVLETAKPDPVVPPVPEVANDSLPAA